MSCSSSYFFIYVFHLFHDDALFSASRRWDSLAQFSRCKLSRSAEAEPGLCAGESTAFRWQPLVQCLNHSFMGHVLESMDSVSSTVKSSGSADRAFLQLRLALLADGGSSRKRGGGAVGRWGGLAGGCGSVGVWKI